MDSLIKDMVEFVGLTDEIVRELESRPAFSADNIRKTAESLVAAGLIRDSEQATMEQAFRQDPNKALESLQKLAMAKQAERVGQDMSLGGPSDSGKPVSRHSRESDRALFDKLGLG